MYVCLCLCVCMYVYHIYDLFNQEHRRSGQNDFQTIFCFGCLMGNA